ncbi:hypothetical protein M197_gp70 [Haloarcula hispanica tailed virus 2]|uniref:Uncharacterized protein n=1 Tax=Haloarcula hispanica tailed virus 2 TaxID=1273751 RepID=R4T6B6_9CAUD|nr:hypothetical protein M197_gp70 [Haloarcula hispanica tailed virus 2]AGM11234.1 hypothetical protein HHTV2_69 [Haloarcula hispanica tailed virus 2]
MSDLTDFGGGVQPPDPPHIQKRKQVPLSVGEKRITAGWIGPVPEREALGYVTKRDEREHRIRALDAYGISTRVLRRLEGNGVEVVLVHEAESDRVLEFTLQQYLTADEVPDRYLMRQDDPQRYVVRADATENWEHGADLYLPADRRVEYE